MQYKTSLFIFRQDFRIHDNRWFLEAIKLSKEVLPVFIFDENILSWFPIGSPVVWFIYDAVISLDKQLRQKWSYLHICFWKSEEIIKELIETYHIDALFHNESYGYNALQRDIKVKDLCKHYNIAHHAIHDFLIVPIEAIPPRKVFTPFYKLWSTHLNSNPQYIYVLPAPQKITSPQIGIGIEKENHHTIYQKLHSPKNKFRPVELWKKRIEQFSFATYDDTRNIPSVDWSSKLSPYIRFWLLSPREVYQKAKSVWANIYISELAWREFWQHIFYNFPYSRDLEFQEKRRNMPRKNNPNHFTAWQKWVTGYPLVDAGMRQLATENRMHNRVRMVVASFLTKDLLIDRRWWEKHFANLLIDYDTNVNIWNRQWSASVGADPKPLRIFSPMLQSERFDPECTYIKKRIPELRGIDPKKIHDPLKYDLGYAKPIVDHYERSKLAKQIYMENSSKDII